MHCFFHITCLLLLPYFLVKLFFIINNGLFNFLLSCHIPCLDDLILANVNDEIHILKKIRKWFDQSFFRRHDARMLAVSPLYDDLQNFAFDPVGRAMCLYGDSAYPLRVHSQAPFRVCILTWDMELFNESMSAGRSSVEWLFGDNGNYFRF